MGRSQNADASQAMSRAMLNCALALMLGAALVQPAGAADTGWTELGPDGGGVLALAVSPHPDRAIYVGTGSGVFRSRDGGATWQLAGLAGKSVLSLAVDPVTAGQVYAGVEALGTGGGGVFVSADGGDTWTPARAGLENPWYPPESPNFTFEPVLSLLVDPEASGTVWAGTNNGLFLSTDGAVTWTHAAFDRARAVDVIAHGNGTLFTAVRDPSYFYRSADRGATWSPLGAELLQASGSTTLGRVVDIAVAPQDPDVVYLITSFKIFRSDDGGEHWQWLGSLPTTVEAVGLATLVALAVDPQDSDAVMVATRLEGVFSSHDGGATWQVAGAGLECGPDDWGVAFKRASAVAFAPAAGAVVLGTERHGVFLRPDGDDVWRPSSRGLHAVGVSALGVDPERPSRLLAATWGLGLLSSPNGGVDWSEDNDGVGDACGPPDFVAWFSAVPDCRMMNDVVWNVTAPDALVAGACGVYRRSAATSAWERLEDSRLWVGSLAAVSERELWEVSWGDSGWDSTLVHSPDGGATWTELSDPPGDIKALNVTAAGDGMTLAAGTCRGLWLSIDAGGTWQGPVAEINAACGQGSGIAVWAVAFDPAEPRRVVAGTGCGVFADTPDGTWRHAGLDEHTVMALAMSAGWIFAGTTDAGVWVSSDAAQTWQQLAGPSGLVSVSSLELDLKGRRLYASTSDHGVFALDLPQPAPRRGGSRTGQARPAHAERVPLTP